MGRQAGRQASKQTGKQTSETRLDPVVGTHLMVARTSFPWAGHPGTSQAPGSSYCTWQRKRPSVAKVPERQVHLCGRCPPLCTLATGQAVANAAEQLMTVRLQMRANFCDVCCTADKSLFSLPMKVAPRTNSGHGPNNYDRMLPGEPRSF